MRFRKSSLMLKLIILIVAVYSTVTLVSLQSQISEKKAEAADLTLAIGSTELENQRLEDEIANVDTEEGITEIARNKLGLVNEGEMVFYDVGNYSSSGQNIKEGYPTQYGAYSRFDRRRQSQNNHQIRSIHSASGRQDRNGPHLRNCPCLCQ